MSFSALTPSNSGRCKEGSFLYELHWGVHANVPEVAYARITTGSTFYPLLSLLWDCYINYLAPLFSLVHNYPIRPFSLWFHGRSGCYSPTVIWSSRSPGCSPVHVQTITPSLKTAVSLATLSCLLLYFNWGSKVNCRLADTPLLRTGAKSSAETTKKCMKIDSGQKRTSTMSAMQANPLGSPPPHYTLTVKKHSPKTNYKQML